MGTIAKIIEKFKRESAVTPQVLLGMEGMAERNEKRLIAIKQEMGEKWILHPAHKKSRLNEPRPV